MIREAIDKILTMAKPQLFPGDKFTDGLLRSDRELHIISPPSAPDVDVSTLRAVVELFNAKIDDLTKAAVIAHVQDHLTVSLIGRKASDYGERHRWVLASCKDDAGKFRFGNFQTPEEFIIGLQGCFVPEVGDLQYVLRTASGLTAELVATSSDDGISQKAGVRTGVVLGNQETIKPRVKLAPYRTFREVDQPISEFIFRLRTVAAGQPPQCALFEADGGRWKLDAMTNVQIWLQRNTEGLTVIA